MPADCFTDNMQRRAVIVECLFDDNIFLGKAQFLHAFTKTQHAQSVSLKFSVAQSDENLFSGAYALAHHLCREPSRLPDILSYKKKSPGIRQIRIESDAGNPLLLQCQEFLFNRLVLEHAHRESVNIKTDQFSQKRDRFFRKFSLALSDQDLHPGIFQFHLRISNSLFDLIKKLMTEAPVRKQNPQTQRPESCFLLTQMHLPGGFVSQVAGNLQDALFYLCFYIGAVIQNTVNSASRHARQVCNCLYGRFFCQELPPFQITIFACLFAILYISTVYLACLLPFHTNGITSQACLFVLFFIQACLHAYTHLNYYTFFLYMQVFSKHSGSRPAQESYASIPQSEKTGIAL